MANIITSLLANNNVRIEFSGRQGAHIRLTPKNTLPYSWTDWMLAIDDFRDLIIPLSIVDSDFLIGELLNTQNKLPFNAINANRQEYILSDDKKIVRRLDAGKVRNKYQTVALFIKNNARRWLPDSLELNRNEILSLLKAMITLDCPANYYLRDSLRNLQYLSALLWVKKENPKLLQGIKKPKANEIFRISLVR